MAQLDNSYHENEELELLKQLSTGPKIATNQEDRTVVYAMMLEDDSEDQGFNSVAQAAADSYSEQCSGVRIDAKVVTHILTVERKIGKGGFGVVYKAELNSVDGKETDQRLCVKLGFHKSHYVSEEERLQAQIEINESIFREAQNFKKLSCTAHENIIGFRFCCETVENEYVIGLEHFEGENLSAFLHEFAPRSLPSNCLYDIMKQCAAAVKHLWSLTIVHCDIKPRNVLYNCHTKKLKFVDFGSAVFLDEVHQHQNDEIRNCCAAGTPEYTAYEMLRNGVDGVVEKSDIYSLGMLYYRLVTQQVPWHFIEEIAAARRDRNNSRVKKKILKLCEPCIGTSPIQDRILSENESFYRENPNECKIIHHMLNLNPSDRPSCEELVLSLTNLDRMPRQSSFASVSDSDTDRPTTVADLDSTAESTLPTEMKTKHEALLEGNKEKPVASKFASPEGEEDI